MQQMIAQMQAQMKMKSDEWKSCSRRDTHWSQPSHTHTIIYVYTHTHTSKSIPACCRAADPQREQISRIIIFVSTPLSLLLLFFLFPPNVRHYNEYIYYLVFDSMNNSTAASDNGTKSFCQHTIMFTKVCMNYAFRSSPSFRWHNFPFCYQGKTVLNVFNGPFSKAVCNSYSF